MVADFKTFFVVFHPKVEAVLMNFMVHQVNKKEINNIKI